MREKIFSKKSQPLKRRKLDSIDIKILNELQENNQLSNLELADRVGISPPPCLRRARALREEGVIMGDVSLIDPYLVGRNMVIFVIVTLERHREDLLEAFERKMMNSPEVTQCYFVSGIGDYLVRILASDVNEYQETVRRLFANEPNILTFRSSIALSRVKCTTKIDLTADHQEGE